MASRFAFSPCYMHSCSGLSPYTLIHVVVSIASTDLRVNTHPFLLSRLDLYINFLTVRIFCLMGNPSEFPMRQNAPRDAQLADKKIAYTILLARLSSAALTSGMRGWEAKIAYAILLAHQSPAALTLGMRGWEAKFACGLCSLVDLKWKTWFNRRQSDY